MTKTPRFRAAFTVSFIAGAISSARALAPLHQSASHMSQMTIAVLFASHWTVLSLSSEPGGEPSRQRVFRMRPSAEKAVELSSQRKAVTTASESLETRVSVTLLLNHAPADRKSQKKHYLPVAVR